MHFGKNALFGATFLGSYSGQTSGTLPRFSHLAEMVNPQHVATGAAEMVRIHGRSAALACELMIARPAQGAEMDGAWPKILEAVRKLESKPVV
jgi:hypothetical protein